LGLIAFIAAMFVVFLAVVVLFTALI